MIKGGVSKQLINEKQKIHLFRHCFDVGRTDRLKRKLMSSLNSASGALGVLDERQIDIALCTSTHSFACN